MAKYNCPNLGDVSIKSQFDKLTQEFGEELAYYIWHNITEGSIKVEVKEEIKPVDDIKIKKISIQKEWDEKINSKINKINNKISELQLKKDNRTATIDEIDGLAQIKYYRDNYLKDDLIKINNKYISKLAELESTEQPIEKKRPKRDKDFQEESALPSVEDSSALPSEGLSITSFTLLDNLQQENDIVNSLASIVLAKADKSKKDNKPFTLDNLLESTLNGLQTEYEFFKYFSEEVPTDEDIKEGANINLEENKKIADRFKTIIDNFNETIEDGKVKYVGFKERIKNKIESLDYDIEEDFDEDDNGIAKNSFEDNWAMKQDAEKSMSAQVKRMLSFIPKRDESGTIKKNTIGYKMYEDYVKVYSLIMNELVDIPIEQLHDTLKLVADKNAISKDVVALLDKMKLEDTQNYNRFHDVFKRQQANFLTILARKKDENGKRSFNVMNTNRAGANDIVVEMWYESFKTKGLSSGLLKLNTDTGELEIVDEKAKELTKEFESNFSEKDFKKRLNIIATSLNKLGIEISSEDLDVLNNYRRLYAGEAANLNGKNISEENAKTYYKGKTNKYSRYFTAKKFDDFIASELRPLFFTLTGRLKDESVTESWQLKNPYYSQSSRIKGLTPYYLEKNPDITSGTFKNGNGDTIQGFIMPSYAGNRLQKIMNDESFRKLLSEVPFISKSTWLNQNVRMMYLDSAKEEKSKQDSKTYAEQSATEKEYTKLALFHNSGRNKSFFIGNTPSDKTTFKVFETEKHTLNFDNRNNVDVFTNGTINKEAIDLDSDTMNTLFNVLVQSEIKRIIAVRRAFNENKTNFKKLIPGYHYVNDDKTNDIVIGSGGYFFFIPELNSVLDKYLVDGQLIEGIAGNLEFKEILRDKIVTLIEDKVKSWNEKGIVNSAKGTFDFDKGYTSGIIKTVNKDNTGANFINTAAADMVTNYMLSYANEFMLITGDPALFTKSNYKFQNVDLLISDTADNIFKRTAKDIAPGVEGLFDSPYFNSIFINEPKHTSIMTEYVDRIGKIASQYNKMDIADAQEWTTLKEHLNVLHAYGKISRAVRNNLIAKAELRTAVSGNDKKQFNFTPEEIGTVLQPIKPVYVSSKYDPELQTDIQYYIKTSSYPLIPQLTENFEIDKLRLAMEKNNIDRAVVHSGVKTGFYNSVKVFDDAGNVNIIDNLEPFIHNLPRDGFRIQQEVPYDATKKSILEGSQYRKMIFGNLISEADFDYAYNENGEVTENAKKGWQLKKLSDKIHNRLYEMKYNDLKESLGIPENENTITNVDKLRTLLAEEATELGYSINDVLLLTGSIKLDNGNVAFEVPLYFHNQSDKIESMLNSIIKNRILKNKMPGKSYVQGSSVGFVTKTKMGTVEFMNEMLKLTKESIVLTRNDKNSSNPEENLNLKGELEYREYEENGKKIIYAEVFAPFNFIREGVPLDIKDYTDDMGFIREDKLDPELLNVLGYRIPTQGHSSMIKLKIVGFLPKEVGDLVIVPSAITKQMGSDFDVDKLYTHTYNYNVLTGGRLEKVNYSNKKFDNLNDRELQNMLMDITYSVLDNEFVQKNLQFQLTDDPTLKNDKTKLNELRGANKTMRVKPNIGSIIYDEYQTHMVDVNAAGKIGIGSYSSASANHVLFQYAGVYLKVPSNSKGKLQPDKAVSVMFKNENGEVYTDKLTGDSFSNDRVNDVNKISYTDAPSEGAWRLDKVNTFTGKLISDVIKSYQSSSVDNAKDQNLFDLNQNKYTFGVSALIARTGFDEYFINRFITQPVIIEYVKKLNNLDNYTDTEFVPDKQKKLQQEMFESLGFDMADWSYGITATSLSEMEAALANNGKDKLYQAKILWNFIKYDEVSREVSKVQSSANTDTAFLGKSIYESLLKKEAIDGKKQFLGNTDNLFDETTQQGAVMYGLDASIDLFSGNNLFPLRSTIVTSIFSQISQELDKELREDIAHNIFSDVRASLFTHAIKHVYNKDVNELRKELFFGNDKKLSLAKRLKSIQEKTNNPFLKILSVVTANKKGEPDVIEFNSSKEIKDELNMHMLLGWNQLLNLPEGSEERQVAEDLVLYNLVNGNQRTARDFGRFLPYDYIKEKLAPYYRLIDFENGNELTDLVASNFVIQWLQHNPYKSREIEFEHIANAQKFDGTAIKKGELPDIITLKPKSDEIMANIYERKNTDELKSPLTVLYEYKSSDGKREDILYKKDGDVYVRIPILGLSNKLLKEYNIESSNQQSMFRGNVESVNKKVTIELTPTPPTQSVDLFTQYNFNGGIKSVLESIVAKGNNSMYKAVAQFYLKNFAAIENYTLDYHDSRRDTNPVDINSDWDMFYKNIPADGKIWFDDKLIVLNKDTVKSNAQFEKAILHEITHALIYARLGSDHKANKELQAIMDGLKKYKELMYNEKWLEGIGVKKINNVLGNESKRGYYFADYIFRDTQEFAAILMTDTDLYKILNNIQYSKDQTFWDKLVEFINELLGIKEFLGRDINLKEGSALTEGLATVLKIINDSDFNVNNSVKEESSSLPTQKVYPMKPVGRIFKLAINKDKEYIDEIRTSDNKRRIVNEHFRFRGTKDFKSKNLPYTEFSYNVPSLDIALTNKINALYTGNVVKYSPSKERIMFTEDEGLYKLKSDISLFDNFSSSPSYVEEELTGRDKLLITKKKQLEIFKGKLTERIGNRDTIKSIISNLEIQIKQLETDKEDKIIEEVANKTLEAINKSLETIQEKIDANPSEDELFVITSNLEEVDVYIEGMRDIDKLFDYETEEYIQRIDVLAGNITRARAKYLKQLKEVTVKIANKFGSERFANITENELFANVEDISFWASETMNMADSPSKLIRLLHQIIQQVKQNILEAQRDVSTSVDTWEKKLEQHTNLKGKALFDMFKQKYDDGSWTGNYIGKYKQEFFDARTNIIQQIKEGTLNRGHLLKWLKENTTMITLEELESGKSSVFSDEEMKEQAELYEKYKNDLDIQRKVLEDTYINNGVVDISKVSDELGKWELENSPKIYLDIYHNNAKSSYKNKGYKYLIYPKPKNKWLDSGFQKIENDPVLFGFYNFMKDTFRENNKRLPYITKLQGNYLPEMTKAFVEKLKGKSMWEAFGTLGDEFWNAITDNVEGEIDYDIILGNRKFKNIPTRMMMNKLAVDKKSDDIFKILKAHTHMANSYQFKSQVEPFLTAGQQYLDEMQEITKRDTIKGKVTTKDNWKQNQPASGKLSHTKKQLEHQLEVFLYDNYRDVEGRMKKVFLSEENKAEIAALDKKLANEEITEAQYKTRVSTIGRQVTLTGVVDVVSKYTYLKALGLPNFMTPTVNLTFGLASNLTYASGGQGTNLTDMRKAISMFMGSLIDKKQLRKIWAFMEEMGILNEYNESLYGDERTIVDTMAFILQTQTERVNRGTLMLSHLLTNKVKNKAGEEVPVYYAFKEVDGKLIWDTDNFGEREELDNKTLISEHGVNMFKMKTLISKTNSRVHGDYDSALRGKRSTLGKMLFMFKTWLPMAIQERFGKEDYDDEMARIVKGRYTVAWTAKDANGNEIKFTELLKLLSVAAFKKDGLASLSEIDRASIRRNLKELQFIAQFAIAVAALSLIAGGDGEDDEKKFILNTAINLLSKSQADLAFFTNPSAMGQMTNNLIPIYSGVKDIFKIVPVVFKTVSGDTVYKSGPFEDQNRLLIWGAEVTPFVNPALRVWKNGERVIQSW